jgi:hypothetical protein
MIFLDCILRLRTSYWEDSSGFNKKVSLRALRRKCSGADMLSEEIGVIGIESVFRRILNLHECPNGLYRLKLCNRLRDPETGHIEDYDYLLVPEDSLGPGKTQKSVDNDNP